MIAPAITKSLATPVPRDYVSWSAVTTYQQCPLRYFFRYVEGLEETFISASLAVGGAIHSAVEFHFNELMTGNPPPDQDTLLGAFWEGWRSRAESAAIQFGRGEDLDSIGKTAERVIAAFRASDFARPQGRILGVEEELRLPLIPGLSGMPVPDPVRCLAGIIAAQAEFLTVPTLKELRWDCCWPVL